MSSESKDSVENWVPPTPEVPDYWETPDFTDLIENISTNGIKIPQKSYLQAGTYPVIDQGQDLIGGYTDDDTKILNDLGQVIIFGDHTRCFKLINFDFAPGADGVKVLKPNDNIDPKYIYYSLKTLQLPNRVYSRHYSFLKKSKLPLPPTNEQKRIVAKIEELFSELDKGIENRRTAREQLKVYRQAVLKHAFEGKLTAEWREENKDKLETADELLKRIKQEREAYYRQQLEEWETKKQGKKPIKLKDFNSPKTSKFPINSISSAWILLPLEQLAAEAVLGKMLDKQKNTGVAQPYLGNINLRWGCFELDNLKTMKIEKEETARYSLKKGDLVIFEGGEPGRCAIWNGEDNTMFIQKALHRVRFTQSYNPVFAYYFMVYAIKTGSLERSFTGTTIKHLTGKGLSLYPVSTSWTE